MRYFPLAVSILASSSAITAGAACGGSGSGSGPPVSEAGADTATLADAAPTGDASVAADAADASDGSAPAIITVTTREASFGPVPGAKANVVWAAYRDATGTWKALAPASTGIYTFTTEGPKWGVALACATPDDSTASVSIYYRTTATTSLDASACTGGPPVVYHKLSGTLSNVAGGSTRFAFGQGLGTLEAPLTLAGTDAAYSVFTVPEGTWDLAYGVRDAFASPLTRMLLRRGEIMGVTDRTLDVDMAVAGSFVPGAKNLSVRGLTTGESLVGEVRFTTQGYALGIALGPNAIPQLVPDNTFSYSTIPAAAAVATDVYRGDYHSSVPGGATARDVAFDFKTPVDVDIAFLPYVAGLAATVSTAAPYVRLETRANAVTNADHYQIVAFASSVQKSQRTWSISYDVAALSPAMALDDVMPDFAAVAGWKNVWALPVGTEASVSVSIVEKPTVLSDGTSVRTTSATTKLTP